MVAECRPPKCRPFGLLYKMPPQATTLLSFWGSSCGLWVWALGIGHTPSWSSCVLGVLPSPSTPRPAWRRSSHLGFWHNEYCLWGCTPGPRASYSPSLGQLLGGFAAPASLPHDVRDTRHLGLPGPCSLWEPGLGHYCSTWLCLQGLPHLRSLRPAPAPGETKAGSHSVPRSYCV